QQQDQDHATTSLRLPRPGVFQAEDPGPPRDQVRFSRMSPIFAHASAVAQALAPALEELAAAWPAGPGKRDVMALGRSRRASPRSRGALEVTGSPRAARALPGGPGACQCVRAGVFPCGTPAGGVSYHGFSCEF